MNPILLHLLPADDDADDRVFQGKEVYQEVSKSIITQTQMNKDKTIEVLNKLIVINNDRIEGYETATEDTKHADLKTLFTQFQQTSRKYKMELVEEVNRLGGTPDEGTRLSGKVYRMWMDIKGTFTGDDRKAVIDWCEYGEDVALDTYREAITENSEDLSDQQQAMLKEHQQSLKADHDKVKTMRDALTKG